MSITIFLDVDGVLNSFSHRGLKDPGHIWMSGKRGIDGIGGL